MRVLIVIALLVGAAFMILVALANLARELSRQSFHAPPDLSSSDDWDEEMDEFADAAPPVASYTEQWIGDRYCDLRTLGGNMRRNSNALDDLRSAL